jgi:hypothetical protein
MDLANSPEIEAFLLKHAAGQSDEAPYFFSDGPFHRRQNQTLTPPSGGPWSVQASPPIARKEEGRAAGRNIWAPSFHSLRMAS